MKAGIVTTGPTEADLEARISEALRRSLPWLDPQGVQHQLTFSFQLGHEPVPIDGRRSSARKGRLDILLEHQGKPLAILELKRPGNPLTSDDVDQGLSYARVLHPRPPIVIVSNGDESQVYATVSGELLDVGVPDEAALAAHMASAAKLAAQDLKDAIATLMGPGSDVWVSAVRSATDATLAEMTGSWADPHPIFTDGFLFPRKASAEVLRALRGRRRVVAVEGAPLVGKSHVLRELAVGTRDEDDLAVLLVEASGTAAGGIAEEIARLLGSALGWRIDAAEAGHWLEKLGRFAGPTLVVAVDGLGLEHEALRRELEALSAKAAGDHLKIVVEADTSVIDRLWTGESRRKETVFGRRGERVLVDKLDDDEMAEAFDVLESMHIGYMDGARRSEEYRQPWLLRTMAASVIGAPEMEAGMAAVMPPLLSLDLFHYTRDRFEEPALLGQAAIVAAAVLDEYRRSDRREEQVLRSMHHFIVRRQTMREHAGAADLDAMERSGLLGTILDTSNRMLLVARIPELVASEVARLLGEELEQKLDGDEDPAGVAQDFVVVCSKLPLGDVIGAQAVIDMSARLSSIPMPFITTLLEHPPEMRSLRPGSRAVAWIPDLGKLDLKTRADGTTEAWAPAVRKGFEIPAGEGMQTYADLDAWMILSHLGGIPQVALTEDATLSGRFDPEILRVVGSSPVPLRRVGEQIERSGLHTHEAPDGSSLVCGTDGIVEPVTFSLFRLLETTREAADDWLDELCAGESAPLLNRVALALRMIARRDAQAEADDWARRALEERVRPALDRALSKSAGVGEKQLSPTEQVEEPGGQEPVG